MKPSARLRISLALALAMLATLLTLAPPAAHAALVGGLDCTTGTPVELWAKTGTRTLPPATSVNVWGYAASSGGTVSIPDTVIVAKANVGCTVTLHNTLGQATALDFQGQGLAPDLTGIAAGADGSYTFTPQRPGTYLYEAGLLPGTQYQVALGMVGVLIVRPADWDGTPGTRTDQGPGTNTDFTDEAAVVLGEIDPALHASATPWTFDLRNYAPRYFTINGEAYPNTAPIGATVGTNLLLRFVNGGLLPHSMGTLGLQQRFVSSDGGVLSAHETEVARSVAPGETADGIIAIPAGTEALRFPLFDQTRLLHNSNAGTTTTGNGRIYDFGGMMTFIEVSGVTTPPATGPTVTNIVVTPDPATGSMVTVTATAVGASGGELYFDSTSGAPLSTTAGVGGSLTWSNVDISTLLTGSHQAIIRATDGTNWGPFNSENFTVDRDGPAINALTLTPNPTNGTTAVVLSGTANDTNKGGSNISNVPQARFRVNGGAWMNLTLATTANPVSAFSGPIAVGSIPTAEGSYAVEIEVSDALGNVGTGTIQLLVDKTAPTSTTVSTLPNGGLTNGKIGVDAATQAIRLIQNFADPGNISNVKAAEAFIDVATPVDGAGIKFLPSDGAFDSPTEMGYADIPLSTITQLTDGIHVVKIHARDIAGNWNTTFNTVTLIVDKAAPAVTTPVASPNPTNAGASEGATFTVTANATDPTFSSGLYGAEWFEGTDPGVGHGTPMSTTTAPLGDAAETFAATIDYVALGWAPGNHTISVRSRDGAGNWSTVKTVSVNVVYPNTIFSDGFESGSIAAWLGTPAGTSRLSVDPTASMGAGSTRGLRVALCSTGSSTCSSSGTFAASYVTDNSPVQDGAYHARFYVNPNGTVFGNNRQITLLAGYTGANNGGLPQAFRVELLRPSAGTYQVRMVLARTNGGTLTSGTVALTPSAANRVEISWLSSNSGGTPKLQISVNGATFTSALAGGALTTWNNAQTGAYSIGSVRFGATALTGGGTSSVTGRLFLDTFTSMRRTVITP